MRAQGANWLEIAVKLGKTAGACSAYYIRLNKRKSEAAWSAENAAALKTAYQQARADMWKMAASAMGYNGSWKVLEAKAFELGMKGLKT